MKADRYRRLAELKARGGIIKICGLRETAHVITAAEAGADLIGLMFAESRRRISPEDATELVAGARADLGKRTPLFTGVFVDESPDRINAVASDVGLDAVQLHGREPSASFTTIDVPVLKAFAPAPDSTLESVQQELDGQSVGPELPALWLIDAWDPVLQGGTGRKADWPLASELSRAYQFLLAGGLSPDNVATAIEMVRPAGVDVSSGVETGGIKDHAKITAFIERARAAFAGLQT